MGDRASYLTNKLNSLRNQGSSTPMMNTVSSNMTMGRGYETIQPSFANRDFGNTYQPITIHSDSLRRTPPARVVSTSPSPIPIAISSTPYYSVPTTSYEPIRASPPRYITSTANPITSTSYPTRSTPPAVLRSSPSQTYEIKANPQIYKLAGLSEPLSSYQPSMTPVSGYTPLPVPSYQQEDLRRLLRPQDDHDIKNKLKSDLYNLSETLTTNDINSLHDSIRTLRDRLPQERANTERQEQNLVQYLLEEDAKRVALAQKILQKEGELRTVSEQHSQLDRQLREVDSEVRVGDVRSPKSC